MPVSDSAAAPPIFDQQAPSDLETAQFALGCFWGPDARFGVLEGVWRTRVGYAGGIKANPTYYSLGRHVETVQVDFDPAAISYEKLLRLFWKSHRPEKRSWKRQYISAVFPRNGKQERAAQKSKDEVAQDVGKTIYTELISDPTFHKAEDYHQKYRLRRSRLLDELAAHYEDARALINAPTSARLNGYVAGHGSSEQLEREIDDFGLGKEANEQLRAFVA